MVTTHKRVHLNTDTQATAEWLPDVVMPITTAQHSSYITLRVGNDTISIHKDAVLKLIQLLNAALSDVFGDGEYTYSVK